MKDSRWDMRMDDKVSLRISRDLIGEKEIIELYENVKMYKNM